MLTEAYNPLQGENQYTASYETRLLEPHETLTHSSFVNSVGILADVAKRRIPLERVKDSLQIPFQKQGYFYPDPRFRSTSEIEANVLLDQNLELTFLTFSQNFAGLAESEIAQHILLLSTVPFDEAQKEKTHENIAALSRRIEDIKPPVGNSLSFSFTFIDGEKMEIAYHELRMIHALALSEKIKIQNGEDSKKESNTIKVSQTLKEQGITFCNFRSQDNLWVEENKIIIPVGHDSGCFNTQIENGTLPSEFKLEKEKDHSSLNHGVIKVVDGKLQEEICAAHFEEIQQELSAARDLIIDEWNSLEVFVDNETILVAPPVFFGQTHLPPFLNHPPAPATLAERFVLESLKNEDQKKEEIAKNEIKKAQPQPLRQIGNSFFQTLFIEESPVKKDRQVTKTILEKLLVKPEPFPSPSQPFTNYAYETSLDIDNYSTKNPSPQTFSDKDLDLKTPVKNKDIKPSVEEVNSKRGLPQQTPYKTFDTDQPIPEPLHIESVTPEPAKKEFFKKTKKVNPRANVATINSTPEKTQKEISKMPRIEIPVPEPKRLNDTPIVIYAPRLPVIKDIEKPVTIGATLSRVFEELESSSSSNEITNVAIDEFKDENLISVARENGDSNKSETTNEETKETEKTEANIVSKNVENAESAAVDIEQEAPVGAETTIETSENRSEALQTVKPLIIENGSKALEKPAPDSLSQNEATQTNMQTALTHIYSKQNTSDIKNPSHVSSVSNPRFLAKGNKTYVRQQTTPVVKDDQNKVPERGTGRKMVTQAGPLPVSAQNEANKKRVSSPPATTAQASLTLAVNNNFLDFSNPQAIGYAFKKAWQNILAA